MNFLIFVAFFLIHNSFAQLPPQVTARNNQRTPSQIPQENDLSLNSLRNELNTFKLQLERVEYSNNQVFNAVKAHRRDVEDVKNALNKVQAQCVESQIFTSSVKPQTVSSDTSSNHKLDNLHQLVLTLRTSLHKIERELIASRKASKRSHWSNSVIHHRNHNIYSGDYESACTAPEAETGIKRIRKNFFIYCENTEDDGNWIVIQNRFNGDIDFFRNWLEYKDGFGNIGGEFWLGLEKIHEVTSDALHELMIIIEDFNGQKRTAKYGGFAISSEAEGYALSVLGIYSGDAGDSLKYHAGMKFSTFDVDNDEWSDGSCAKSHMGGWWYKKCDESNLNGAYFPDGENPIKSNDYKGMHWKHASDSMGTLKSVKMMIRPID